jgi:predicted lipoprotein with Yx(FWY)xxD motif
MECDRFYVDGRTRRPTRPSSAPDGAAGAYIIIRRRSTGCWLHDGTVQLTYDGKPLYFYSAEDITVKAGKFAATGSGQGRKAPAPAKGTFSLVTP